MKRPLHLLRPTLAAAVGGVLSLGVGALVSRLPEAPFEGYLAGTTIGTALLILTYYAVYFVLRRGDPANARRRAFALHSLLGLTTGLVWTVFVLSGVLLMFRPEIELAANAWRRVEPLAERAPPDAWLAAVADRADLAASREIQIVWPHARTDTAVVWVHGAGSYARFDVDPYRAAIVEGEASRFMGTVRDLHTHLLLGDPGRWLGGGVSLAAAWLLLGGLGMGGRVFRDAFRLRTRRGGAMLLSDLHKRIGLWTLPLLALYAFTGVAYEWGHVVGHGPQAARFDGDLWAMYRAAGAPPSVERGTPAPTPPIADFVGTLQHTLPGSRPVRVRILGYGDAAAVVSIAGERDGDLAPSSLLLNLRATTGEVLLEKNVESLGPFERTNQALHALHYGHYRSLPLRVLHAAASLAIGVLPLLGIALWALRRRRPVG
ncbi:MAG: PepSY-associated TM helix domain-containing protein [Myxococcota bacterium]